MLIFCYDDKISIHWRNKGGSLTWMSKIRSRRAIQVIVIKKTYFSRGIYRRPDINSLWPSDAIWWQGFWSALDQVTACSGNVLLPDGTKSLPKPLLNYHSSEGNYTGYLSHTYPIFFWVVVCNLLRRSYFNLCYSKIHQSIPFITLMAWCEWGQWSCLLRTHIDISMRASSIEIA